MALTGEPTETGIVYVEWS